VTPLGGGQFSRFSEHYKAAPLQAANGENSFEWFLRWLAFPSWDEAEALWQAYFFVHGLMHLDTNAFSAAEARERWKKKLEEAVPDSFSEIMHQGLDAALLGALEKHGSGPNRLLKMFLAADPEAVREGMVEGMRIVTWLDDGLDARDKSSFEQIWTGYLRLYNLFQFLPHAYFISQTGIDAGEYDSLSPLLQSLGKTTQWEGPSQAWTEIYECTDDQIHPLLRQLIEANWPPPVIPPFELTNEGEETIGEAELGWADVKVAFLTKEQLQKQDVFTEAGWQALSLEEVIADTAAYLDIHEQRKNG